MNILLTAVNAKYIHSNLAVYSLKASAGRYADQVELAEYTINHQTDVIFQEIYRKKPDLLFFSCYIWNRQVILEVSENIKKVLPHTIIWAGGPEVSYDAEAFLLQNPQFDGVMAGEGERTFRRLLQYYIDEDGTLEQINGIWYRKDGKIVANAPAELMESLDELPFVYSDLSEFQNRIIYYESSRGCPFSCSYCLSSIDKKVRLRSLELVKQELAFFLEQKVAQVKFVDRTFNCSHTHAMGIWEFIHSHDNGVTNFHFEIAADLLNEEELALLARMRPGLVQLEIGVQTVNVQALEAIHRTAKFEKIVDRTRKIAANRNIHQHLDLIAGLPYEDFESFTHSFDAVYRLHPQELQLGFLKLLKGSQMHERSQEYGIVCRSQPPYEVLATKWISCDELLRLKEVEEMLEVYYNSWQFGRTISELETQYERPYELYAALADFYKENGLNGQAWSRLQRLEHLRMFLRDRMCGEETDLELLQRYDELLTMDLYLRENAKSRPLWAADLSEWKSRIAEFYQREEKTRRYLPDYPEMNWKQLMRMTHLERFVFLDTQSGERNEQWILFDYRKRDPLTYDAFTQCVEIEEREAGQK